MSQFLDSIKEVSKSYKSYDNWEQNQADDVAKRRYLSQKLDLPKDKIELTKSKAQAVFRASDIMDKRSEDNCADMERTTGIISTVALLPVLGTFMYYPSYLTKKGKPMNSKQLTRFNLISMALILIPSIGLSLWSNSKQKDASRIGRFQAKQHELKDAKNFAIYTPEQIEAAKILAKNIPDKKDKKSIAKLFADMKQMSQDKVEYKKWLETKISSQEEIQKILNTEFTPKQIAQGEEDKEIIVNIVKDVNMNAEAYSENVENAFDTIGMMSLITDIPIYFGINKLLKNFKNVSPATKQIAPWLACTFFPLAMLFWATREKKEASRVGRFVKRQEILDNPELIMSYSDEQLKQAENIKGPSLKKGFFKKIGDNFTFFGKYLKEAKEYKEYKKTTAKENEKLYEALKQTDISKSQLKEAKNLQEKTFRTFDKVDEMSQRYSEDTEAATEIAKQLMNPIFTMIGIGIPALAAVAVAKGKFPLKGIIKTASNFALKKDSSIRTFIDKASEIINKDAGLKKDFSKIFIDKKVQERVLTHPEMQKLYLELASKNEKILTRILKIKDSKDTKEIENIANEVVNANFKQDPVSKWFRNLSEDIFKLWANKKFKTQTIDELAAKSAPKTDSHKKTMKFYNEYKTLCNTLLFGGFIPILGVGVGIPFAIASWMTNIQVKAGRIGVMKAMEEIDNPKLFVKDDPENKSGNAA